MMEMRQIPGMRQIPEMRQEQIQKKPRRNRRKAEAHLVVEMPDGRRLLLSKRGLEGMVIEGVLGKTKKPLKEGSRPRITEAQKLSEEDIQHLQTKVEDAGHRFVMYNIRKHGNNTTRHKITTKVTNI